MALLDHHGHLGLVGLHLGLLANYFPGYRVSWTGSLIGLVYGALLGGVIGWCLAWIYNRLARPRGARGPAA